MPSDQNADRSQVPVEPSALSDLGLKLINNAHADPVSPPVPEDPYLKARVESAEKPEPDSLGSPQA